VGVVVGGSVTVGDGANGEGVAFVGEREREIEETLFYDVDA